MSLVLILPLISSCCQLFKLFGACHKILSSRRSTAIVAEIGKLKYSWKFPFPLLHVPTKSRCFRFSSAKHMQQSILYSMVHERSDVFITWGFSCFVYVKIFLLVGIRLNVLGQQTHCTRCYWFMLFFGFSSLFHSRAEQKWFSKIHKMHLTVPQHSQRPK